MSNKYVSIAAVMTYCHKRGAVTKEELLSHQLWAGEQLDKEVAEGKLSVNEIFQNFSDRWYGKIKMPTPPASTTSFIQLEFKPTDKFFNYNGSDFRVFALALTNNGKVVDSVPALSGAPNTQSEAFVRPEDDFSGSMRCLPEGVYDLGSPQYGLVEDSTVQIGADSFGDGLGRFVTELIIKPQYKVNNRDAFFIHDDSNRATSPGSAGCISFFKTEDFYRLLGWLNAQAKPTQLVCDLGTGFLKNKGYKPLTGQEKPQTTGASDIHPQVNAFLKTIRVHEGTKGEDGYNICFTGVKFSGYKDHPRRVYCSGALCSDAAGAYQFLSTTWDELGLPDFSPANQDKGAIALIKRRGGYNDLIAGDLDKVLDACSWEWASLPASNGNGRYGQPSATVDEIYRLFAMYGGIAK